MTDEDEATYDDYCYSCACHHDNPSDGSWDCESEDNASSQRRNEMTVLTQAHAEALRKVTTYLAEEHDDMQMFVERGGNPERHIAHYVAVLERLLNDYDTTLKGETK